MVNADFRFFSMYNTTFLGYNAKLRVAADVILQITTKQLSFYVFNEVRNVIVRKMYSTYLNNFNLLTTHDCIMPNDIQV